jgi:DNA-binding SARP family transcriptional activator
LADDATIEGDPVVLRLRAGTVVDVDLASSGDLDDALRVTALGSELLEGLTVRGGGAFESWLLSEQRRVAAASAEILRKAALNSMSLGDYREAIGYAVRLVTMTPLDENVHALLIRLYRMVGDDVAAERQFATCARMLSAELGTTPGTEVRAALYEAGPTERRTAGHRQPALVLA